MWRFWNTLKTTQNWRFLSPKIWLQRVFSESQWFLELRLQSLAICDFEVAAIRASENLNFEGTFTRWALRTCVAICAPNLRIIAGSLCSYVTWRVCKVVADLLHIQKSISDNFVHIPLFQCPPLEISVFPGTEGRTGTVGAAFRHWSQMFVFCFKLYRSTEGTFPQRSCRNREPEPLKLCLAWAVAESNRRHPVIMQLVTQRYRNHKSLAIANHNFEVASFSRRNHNEIAELEVFSESQWFFWVAIAVASDLRFEVAAIRVTLLSCNLLAWLAYRSSIELVCMRGFGTDFRSETWCLIVSLNVLDVVGVAAACVAVLHVIL